MKAMKNKKKDSSSKSKKRSESNRIFSGIAKWLRLKKRNSNITIFSKKRKNFTSIKTVLYDRNRTYIFTSITRRLKSFISRNRGHILILLILLSVSFAVHSINMFNYPYYENDEGTYFSRGWALIELGQLDPYTFWYDHVPFASFMVGLWILITGGIDTFGYTLNSGRVLMMFLHLFDVILIYYISYRITGRKYMGIIAILLFSLSPLSIYFYRRILLDNIIIFWMLLSIAILLKKNLTFMWVMVSAVTVALGILTKENVVLFLPVYLYLISIRSESTGRNLAIFNWLILVCAIVGLYFIYGLLKAELFAPGMLGTPSDSVSLLDTLRFHLGRGNGYPFWHPMSDFMTNFSEWVRRDSIIMSIGISGTFVLGLLSVKDKWARVLFFFLLVHAWYLMRGGFILNFYILPVIPFIAMSVGYISDKLFNSVQRKSSLKNWHLYVAIIPVFAVYASMIPSDFFIKDENEPYRAAVEWARMNLNVDEFIVVDNAMYLDLRTGEKPFTRVEWFWKVDTDPDVYEKMLGNDWKEVDYIFISHETVKQVASGYFPIVHQAIFNSNMLRAWDQMSSSYIDINQLISTNGDWIRVHKIPSRLEIQQAKSIEYFKSNFIATYGQVYDGSGVTTSYMQTSGMQLALDLSDKTLFDSIRAWGDDRFTYRGNDSLLSSEWEYTSPEDGNLSESVSRSRADIQYAATLLIAHEKWGDMEYLNNALEVVSDIWAYEVVEMRGRYYVLRGSDGMIFNPQTNSVDRFALDPYAVNPYYLDLFSKYDPDNPWEYVKEDWYDLVDNLLLLRAPSNGLSILPNEVILRFNGSLQISPNNHSLSHKDVTLLSGMYMDQNVRIPLVVRDYIDSLSTFAQASELSADISLYYALLSDYKGINEDNLDYKDSNFKKYSELLFDYETGEWSDIVDLSTYQLILLLSNSFNSK